MESKRYALKLYAHGEMPFAFFDTYDEAMKELKRRKNDKSMMVLTTCIVDIKEGRTLYIE